MHLYLFSYMENGNRKKGDRKKEKAELTGKFESLRGDGGGGEGGGEA